MPTVSRSRPSKKRLVTRADLARLKGVSRAAVSSACKGVLADAVVGTGVDLSHAAVQAWLVEPSRGPEAAANPAATSPGHPQKMQALNQRKRAAEADRLELANATTRGALISRQLVEIHVFGALEFFGKRLLTDTAKAIAARALPMARAGDPVETLQSMVRDEISRQLRAAKDRASRALRRPAPVPQLDGGKRKSKRSKGKRRAS